MDPDRKILRAVQQSDRGEAANHPDFIFWCPGCHSGHGVWTTKKNIMGGFWKFNGNMEKPTFEPSILLAAQNGRNGCHCYVRDGNIEFLPDCTHELAGKTVPMEPF